MTNRQAPYEIATYYFPQYHVDPRNQQWHGHDWTEWELVKAARPRYPGHRQPIVPAWGYFDECDPAWSAREIDLAADSGITTFLYDWYWYEDGPFLVDALEQGFFHAPNRDRMKFALMWANHDWLNIHPALLTNQPQTLAAGGISRSAFEQMTDYIVTHYFSQPNYLKLNGAPYFSLYELGTFITGLGGFDEALRALQSFRAKTRAAGFPDLHLNAVVWGVQILPSELRLVEPESLIAQLKFDSVGSYAWVHSYEPGTHGFPQDNYEEAAKANFAAWEAYHQRFALPYFPNVTMGWDPSPRTVQSDIYEPRGYPWTAILTGNTPDAFHQALTQAKMFLDEHADAHLLTLNAWNEWTEGSYLLPDTITGTAYLEAIRSIFGLPH